MMPVRITPEYMDVCQRLGLTSAQAFFQLTGEICSGHPNRHVCRLTLNDGDRRITCFLKKEHRIPLRDRLVNWLQGFGFVSKSLREFAVLRCARELGINCPQAMAAGVDGQGRAFLLLREIPGAVDLPPWLHSSAASLSARRGIAKRLGETIARLHEAGIDHPDLYAKHILVTREARRHPGCSAVAGVLALLDFQRSRRRKMVSWPRRFRDLAALDASLANGLASLHDRMACLRSYLRACDEPRPDLYESAWEVRKRSARMRTRRRFQEMRQPPLPTGDQNLFWLDGEAVCVTRQYREELGDRAPEFLQSVYAASATPSSEEWHNNQSRRLVSRKRNCFWEWLLNRLRRKPLTSPELREAGTIFRLERYRISAPRLLAFGQRQSAPWRQESFLLVAPPPDAVPFEDWWLQNERLRRAGSVSARSSACRNKITRYAIKKAAIYLRSLHTAGCVLGENTLLIVPNTEGNHAISVDAVRGMRPSRHLRHAHKIADLQRLLQRFADFSSRTEQLRFLLQYLNSPRQTPTVRKWIEAVTGQKRISRRNEEQTGRAPA